MARLSKPALFAILAVAAVLLIFAWTQYSARKEAERSLGLDAARIVSAQFSTKADLRVGTLRGELVASGKDKGLLGLLPSEQVTALPYTVDYYLKLSELDQRAYRWDAQSKTLTIDVPDVTVAPPNIQEAAAQSQQKGLFISRRAAQELARQVSQRAAAKSRQEALKPENLNRARENARAEIARMSGQPLAAAGLANVRVAVRYPWEPRSPSAAPVERWDQSRAMEEVLKERREQGKP
jgi:hypothetical protein